MMDSAIYVSLFLRMLFTASNIRKLALIGSLYDISTNKRDTFGLLV